MARYRPRDLIALLAVLTVAAFTRLVNLGIPASLVFDESYYAQDACVYLRMGADTCFHTSEVSWPHPPLGKSIIALGIALGGYQADAWRAPSAICGVITVGAVYVLARRLAASSAVAALGAGVLALDPLSIVSSRLAMLDIFVACAGVLAVLFATLHRDWMDDHPSSRPLLQPWLVAAGCASGAAISIKWSGALVLGSVLFLTVAWEIDRRRRRTELPAPGYRSVASILVMLVVLPAAIYVASYAGRLEAEVLTAPWERDAWVRTFAGRQLRMAAFHFGLDAPHPYASPPWSWLIGKRAVAYFFEIDSAGRYREILGFANLWLWLPAVAAAGWAGAMLARRRSTSRAEFVVFVALAGSYLPWLLVSAGRSFVFLHYIVPAIPFFALALAWAVGRLSWPVKGWAAGAIAAISLAVAVFWSPLVYAWPISYEEWRLRIPFTDCSPMEIDDGVLRPWSYFGASPEGWCWV